MISTFSPLHLELRLLTGDQTQTETGSASWYSSKGGQALNLIHAQGFAVILLVVQSGKVIYRVHHRSRILFYEQNEPDASHPASGQRRTRANPVTWLGGALTRKLPVPGGTAPQSERREPAAHAGIWSFSRLRLRRPCAGILSHRAPRRAGRAALLSRGPGRAVLAQRGRASLGGGY